MAKKVTIQIQEQEPVEILTPSKEDIQNQIESNIEDNLSSDNDKKSLSAKQGKVLKDEVDFYKDEVRQKLSLEIVDGVTLEDVFGNGKQLIDNSGFATRNATNYSHTDGHHTFKTQYSNTSAYIYDSYSIVNGNKYFIKAKVKSTSAFIKSVGLVIATGTTRKEINSQSIANQWEELTGVLTADDNYNAFYVGVIFFGGNTFAGGETIECEDFVAYDVTSIGDLDNSLIEYYYNLYLKAINNEDDIAFDRYLYRNFQRELGYDVKAKRFGTAFSLYGHQTSIINYESDENVTSILTYGKNLVDPNQMIDVGGYTPIYTFDEETKTLEIGNSRPSGTASIAIQVQLAKGVYMLSCEDAEVAIGFYQGGSYINQLLSGTNKSQKLIVTADNTYRLRIDVPEGQTLTFVGLMLEVGGDKTEYENFDKKVTYSVGDTIVSNYTFMSIGGNTEVEYQLSKNDTYTAINNPIFSKRILWNGDSIIASKTFGVVGWPTLIGRNNFMDTVNYAVDGGTISYVVGKHCISRTVDTQMSDNADIIILEGGINDYWENVDLGTITGDYAGPFDDEKFCGAFEQMLHDSILKWKGKKIGFIIIHKVANTTPESYFEKAREICNKWSVPYLDLYINGLLMPLDNISEEFSLNDDGTHPNYDGYVAMMNKVENFIKSL